MNNDTYTIFEKHSTQWIGTYMNFKGLYKYICDIKPDHEWPTDPKAFMDDCNDYLDGQMIQVFEDEIKVYDVPHALC